MEPERAFEGVRVVELAQWVFVPVAGALLADWGADVIRIERLEGDPYRGLATQGIGADSGGVNLSMALANRGKRSVALNLRHESGLAVLHELLASADVFLTSLRPGALSRLGLDADTLRARYPAPRLRPRPWLRRARPGRQPARLRQLGVLGARGSGPHPHPARARLPDQPARRHGRPKRRDGTGFRHRDRAAQASQDRRRFGGRRVAAGDRDVDAVV